MKEKLMESSIWSVAVCGSGTDTVGKCDERVVNALGTWCWGEYSK
jgi:hypothetical protein